MSATRPSEIDFAVLRRIHTDTGTMRTLAVDGSILSDEESREAFHRHLRHWNTHEFGIWLFSDLSSGESIGYCGLRKYELDSRPETELYYAVRSGRFRMGYGFEMAQAVVGVGFGNLGLPSIIAFTQAENTASRALIKKLGMRYEGVMKHSGLPHVLYRLRHQKV